MARHFKVQNVTTQGDTTPESPMWTSSEVMALLRIKRATLCGYCRKGLIPHLRMPDNSYRFNSAAIRAWIASRSNG
ncbi:helix-turn-helix domain-containing protein [Edaphobacter sp. HDX4]